MASYMVPILQVHRSFLMVFTKCLQYAMLSLACNRNLYQIIFRSRNLEAGGICQDSASLDSQKTKWSGFHQPLPGILLHLRFYLWPQKGYYHLHSKVDYLQYQEHVTHKNKNKEGSRIELYGTPDKISSEEWKKESTLNFCWQFDK